MATSFRWSRRARNPCACSSLRVDTHREYHLHRHRCINNAVVKMRRRGRPCAPSHSTLAVGKVAATIQPVDAGFLSQAMACTAVPLPHLQAGQSGTMFLPPCVCVHMCPVRAAQNPEQLAGSLLPSLCPSELVSHSYPARPVLRQVRLATHPASHQVCFVARPGSVPGPLACCLAWMPRRALSFSALSSSFC